MRPPKREITKPVRYQTTESSDSENNIYEKYELTRDEVQNNIENDIHALSKILVETQEVLENKDGESISLPSNRSQLSKPCIRSNIVLDPPLKYVKASARYYNEPAMYNSSKQYDIPIYLIMIMWAQHLIL